jgi:hypothetical protein
MAYVAPNGKMYDDITDYQKEIGNVGQGEGMYSGVVNSDNIKPATETPFESPPENPPPSVNFDVYTSPPMRKTPAETDAQSLSDRLRALNDSLVGQSAYRTEQEEIQDIAGLTKTRTDLANQMKILQNEALAIPQQMQLSAEGRGMTAGGLAPLQASKLRENSIKALTISALLEASNNNLATANDLVDRAVKAKYDPIKEEIDAEMANLRLIIESPDYTIADKNRAQAQLDAQNAKKKAVDGQEAEQKEIWDIATTAAKNGADALTLQKIQQAKTKEEALQVAQESGAFQTDEVLSVAEAKALGVPYGTTKNQAMEKGIIPSDSDTVTKGKGYSWAEELINLNPEAEYTEAFSSIQANTDLRDSEIKNFLLTKGIKEGGTFLTKDFFKERFGSMDLTDNIKESFGLSNLSEKELKKKAKAAGFNEGGFLGIGTGEGGVKKYIESLKDKYFDSLMILVEQYRQTGLSDQEILKMMQ